MNAEPIVETQNKPVTIKRRGGFKPGQSGNPGGRPKGLGQMIRDLTSNGKELVILHLQIMRGKLAIDACTIDGQVYKKTPSFKDRLEAASWLADRGFGKTEQTNINQTIIMGGDVDLVKNIRDAAMEIAGLTNTGCTAIPASAVVDIESDCSLSSKAVETSVDNGQKNKLVE